MEHGPRLGSPLRRVREFNRLSRVLDEVWAVNGGEAPADGDEVQIAGLGTFGTRSRPARTRRNPWAGEAVSISASVSPSSWGRKGSQGCVECRLEVVAVGWLQIPTWNATDTPDMETSRLRYDDGHSRPHSSIAGKSQCGRRVAGFAAAGLDTRLHMRQGSSVPEVMKDHAETRDD